jgi:peptide/nickel transport system permease protein
LVVITLVSAVLWSAIIGGTRRTRLITFVGSGVVTLLMLLLVSMTSWLRYPRLGFIGVAVLAGITAFCLTALMAGMQNRKALFAALTTAGIGVAVMWPLQWVFQPSWMEMIVGPVGPIHFQMTPWGTLALLALSAVVVGCLVGWLYGGFDRKVSMRISALTALIVGLFIFADRLLQSWPHYLGMGRVRAPISTIGSSTPGLSGDPAYNFWTSTLDVASHLILPTITLMLITFAGYTRYARSSLLEVMNQDYVRTARAKGLPERVVTMRHAFRNALIPLATLIPLDFAFMFSGAIITEQIFGWRAMGSVFINGLRAMDAPPVMAHFIVVGSLALVATIVIDLIYAALDPRIRVNA